MSIETTYHLTRSRAERMLREHILSLLTTIPDLTNEEIESYIDNIPGDDFRNYYIVSREQIEEEKLNPYSRIIN